MTGLLAACQAKGDVRPAEVVLHARNDEPALTLTRTATGCHAEPGALMITVAGSAASAGGWQLGPGPVGRELRSPGGLIARVVDEAGPPRRLSLIDPIGVPMVRLTADGEVIHATNAARAPIGRIERANDGVRLVAGDQQLGRVTGDADLDVAARLLAPADLPLPARALLACERLAAVTPAVK